MTTWRATSIALAGAVLLLVAACGGQPSAGPGDSPSAERVPSDGLAVRVDLVGGYAPPGTNEARLPIVSVYGDGRVIAPGPQIMIYPPPALPNAQVRRISTDNVAKLVEMSIGAGVGSNVDLGRPQVQDPPSTRFTVRSGGQTKVLTVFALAEADGAPGLSTEQIAARKKRQNLLAALTNLPETLGHDAVSKEEQYTPTSVAAVVTPSSGAEGGATAQPAMAWPGRRLPGEPLAAPDVTCVLLTGDSMTKVLDAARSANSLTPWISEGKAWIVALRPLMPDESACADLAG